MSEACEVFLTPDEVKRLTGYKRPHDQRKWLVAHGRAFENDCVGRPIIHRETMNNRFGIYSTTPVKDVETELVLDFSKVR